MPPLPPTRLPGFNPRVVCYFQTYHDNGDYVSLLPLVTNSSGCTHVILSAVHINWEPSKLTLNDDPPEHPKYTELWDEMMVLQDSGIKVLCMLGGAAKGSFARLDYSESRTDVPLARFESYYTPLRDFIRSHKFDGIDLDVEEEMSLPGVIHLIDRLKADFGERFLITLAPVATALMPGRPHLSGFDYQLLEAARGRSIAWYNTQFYNGWGGLHNTAAYDEIMRNGWPANKVVAGMLTNPRHGGSGYIPLELTAAVISVLIEKYPDFGGVMGWEYWSSYPQVENSWVWPFCMTLCMGMRRLRDAAIVVNMGRALSSADLRGLLGNRDVIFLDPASLPAFTGTQHDLHCVPVTMVSTLNAVVGLASTVLRLSAYTFLRWIPGHHFPPVIVTTLLAYLTLIFANSGAFASHHVTKEEPLIEAVEEAEEGPAQSKTHGTDTYDEPAVYKEEAHVLKTLIFGVPDWHDLRISYFTIALNVVLTAMCLDLVFRGPFFYSGSDLRFTRVGYVDHYSAKILVREPDVSVLPITVGFRAFDSNAWSFSEPIEVIGEETDYTAAILLTGLDQETSYYFALSNDLSGSFTTAPAPNTLNAKSLTFLTSSCIKANFPYNPFAHSLTIHGLKYMSRVLKALPSPASFMLFLGDFIYVDVPFRLSSSTEHYRSEYRRVYQSPSWNLPGLDLPWLHTLDDHEIANDWAGGNQTEPFPAASDPFVNYHVSVNPPIPRSSPPGSERNTTYFQFRQGPASFFMMDTRRYRTNPETSQSTVNSTKPMYGSSTTASQEPEYAPSMLGPLQLQALLDFLYKAENPSVQWKFVASSVPFTKNWRFGTSDTWGGFLSERQKILDAMHYAEQNLGVRVIILSGDRHEFAAVRFPPPVENRHEDTEQWDAPQDLGPHEFSVGPLSMFYLPIRTFKQIDEQDVALAYLPDGNSKMGVLEIRPRGPEGHSSVLRYSLWIDGRRSWQYTLLSVSGKSSQRSNLDTWKLWSRPA